MKCAEFSNLLTSLGALTPEGSVHDALQVLSEFFAKAGAQTVAAVAKRLGTVSIARGENLEADGSTEDVALRLERLQSLLAIAGAKKAVEDLASVIACLRAGEGHSVKSWLHVVETQLATKGKAPRKASVTKRSNSTNDIEEIVNSYLTRLSASGWDATSFESVILDLAKDRSVSVAAARIIGERFSHLNSAKLSKAKVVEGVRREFMDRLRTRNELGVVAKTKPW